MDITSADPAGSIARERILADLGEMAGPLVHEFNNLLNNLVLHLAIWEQSASVSQRDDLMEMRRQIKEVVHLANQFQERRRSLPGPAASCRLDEVATELAAECEGESDGQIAVQVEIDDSARNLAVQASRDDVLRLGRFLLRNARSAAATSNRGEVVIRAEKKGSLGLLTVADSGRMIAEQDLPRLFTPNAHLRDGQLPLELAACQKVAQRIGARLTAYQRLGGGLAVEAALSAVGK